MPLLVSLTINDNYIAYVFKIIIQTNKTLFGCKCLVLKNLKQNPPINKSVFKKLVVTCAGMERVSVHGELDKISRKILNITWLNQLTINLLIC